MAEAFGRHYITLHVPAGSGCGPEEGMGMVRMRGGKRGEEQQRPPTSPVKKQ